jgi:cytochrome b561
METRRDYSVGQKVVHWLMGLLIVLDLFIAQKFGRTMEEWDRLDSRIDHASLCTIVTLLFVIRLYLRIRHGAPPLPAGMSDWQIRAARAGHFLMYLSIGVLVITGLATATNAAAPIPLFGVLDITIGQSNEDFFQAIRPIHEFATNAVIALIVIHVVAALYHHFVARDNSTMRMLRFWKSEQHG